MDSVDYDRDEFAVTSIEALASVYKKPADGVLRKVTDYIPEPGRAFIAASPFIVLSTATERGSMDSSPKGDAPGFVQLVDDRTLLIPDRPGNNRIDGMKNIIANPKVGIIFLVPGVNETFRVNGTARISIAPNLLSRFLVQGKRPRAVLVVKVDEAFSHCPKALVRSNLWRASANGRPPEVPSIGEFAAFRDGGDAAYAEKYNEEYAKRIPQELY